MSDKASVPVLQCDLNWNVIREFKSAIEAAKAVNRPASNVNLACKKPSKVVAGFKFKYKDPNYLKNKAA